MPSGIYKHGKGQTPEHRANIKASRQAKIAAELRIASEMDAEVLPGLTRGQFIELFALIREIHAYWSHTHRPQNFKPGNPWGFKPGRKPHNAFQPGNKPKPIGTGKRAARAAKLAKIKAGE